MSRLNKKNIEIEKRRSFVKMANKLNFDGKNAIIKKVAQSLVKAVMARDRASHMSACERGCSNFETQGWLSRDQNLTDNWPLWTNCERARSFRNHFLPFTMAARTPRRRDLPVPLREGMLL